MELYVAIQQLQRGQMTLSLHQVHVLMIFCRVKIQVRYKSIRPEED